MARETFTRYPDGMRAEQPAGSVEDWTLDEAAEMAATGDSISTETVVWNLATGLTAGAIINTATKSSIFIVAPAASRADPYLCTLTYHTTGGRTRVKAFWLYVIDPVLFV